MRKYYLTDITTTTEETNGQLNRDDFFLYYKSALLLSLTEKNLLTKVQYEQCLALLKKK